MGEPNNDSVRTNRKVRTLAAITVGNSFEWYEWAIYGIFAPFIAAAMFDNSDPVSALLSTFAVFAVGFFMRPIGGVVFGRIADRRGRKFVLVATLLMMGTGSLLIGFLPDYDSLGVWASLLLLLARMLQGFAHGGESATSYSYIAELAPPEKRGAWSSFAFVAVLIGTVFAFVLGVALTAHLGQEAVSEWAWRVPFIVGAVGSFCVLFLRSKMEESAVFSQQAQPSPAAVKVSTTGLVRPVLICIGLICGLTVFQYTWLTYIPSYAIVHQGVSAQSAYLALAGAQFIALVCLPFWGRLGDTIGRRPVFIGWALLVAVLQIPLVALAGAGAWSLFVAGTIAWVLATATGALQAAALAEQFSTRQRTMGIGLAFSVSVAVFGGATPYLNEYLHAHGYGWLAPAWVIGAALLTGLTAWLMPERNGADLAHVGHTPIRQTEDSAPPR
ncbi:MFS transporter [Mycobacterium sp. NAZ190054]|uniref:MFS transporter n=1 Tax=Mycobacterium sp. NAZ190054 TaxID=1747766 RepID=UPI001E48EA35|nr:MFS transporter [Mycobacterium sp. NAZ190054]